MTPGPSTSLLSHTPPLSTPETSIQSNLPVSEPPKRRKLTQTEKNKKKKAKYKLKKKQLNNHNPHNNKSTRKNKYFLTTTRRWLWKTRKSDDFTTKHKKSLFKAHHISKIIEQNNSLLFNLKSTISHTSFKNNSGNISFSQLSSTQQTPATFSEEIEYLENENRKLKKIISNIKTTEKTDHQRCIQQLKKITPNHGYYLRKRINNLTTNLNKFLYMYNYASTFGNRTPPLF